MPRTHRELEITVPNNTQTEQQKAAAEKAAADKAAAEKAAAEKAAEENAAAEEAAKKKGKVTVLSTNKRDGKTVQVLTDGVRTWKETK